MSKPTYEQAVKVINELHGIQKSEPSSRTDEYMRGMYNGMEVIRASVIDNDIDLIDKDGRLFSEIKSAKIVGENE